MSGIATRQIQEKARQSGPGMQAGHGSTLRKDAPMSTVQDNTQAQKIANEKFPATPWQTNRQIMLWPNGDGTNDMQVIDTGETHTVELLNYLLERFSVVSRTGELSTHTSVSISWDASVPDVGDRQFDVNVEHIGPLIAALVSAAAEAAGAHDRAEVLAHFQLTRNLLENAIDALQAPSWKLRRRAEVDEQLREQEG